MGNKTNLYGLVLSGGKSTRMGCDKSMLVYHKKPQRYHVYEMLATVCDKVFISCNSAQLAGIDKNYQALVDPPAYKQCGPMAALLTAFTHHPGYDLLVLGCDYPFVREKDVTHFYSSIKSTSVAAAFYNYEQQLYEPLLAWYSSKTAPLLMQLFKSKNYSLQYFLERNKAQRFYPPKASIITSIDTPEAMVAARELLKRNR